MTDDHLLRKLKDHQQDALELMMKKYRPYVYTILSNMLGTAGSSEDVEELLQDTFYAIWSHADSIYEGKLKAYLITTARNKAKTWLQQHQDLPMALDTIEIPDPKSSPEDTSAQREQIRQLRRAIHSMRPKDREIFLRHYYYLQTTKEISMDMNIPVNTVLSRLMRGRKKLQKMLNKEESF